MTRVLPADGYAQLQATTAAVAEMERNGLRLDCTLAAEIEGLAAADERRILDELRAWWYERGWVEEADDPSHPAPDDVWSSQVNLPAFLCTPLGLNMTPSPFWAKGRTKAGEVSTDHAALDWYAANYPEHRAGITLIKDLRRARSSLKYARKFPTYVDARDGLIHPVCGAASDSDDRSGAISGRLAVKLPELQQVPRDARKDRYKLRRLFVAGPDEGLIVADYSALEVVILAQLVLRLFGDDRLAAKVAPGAPDIHATTARDVFSLLDDPVASFYTPAQLVAACGKVPGEEASLPFGPLPGRPPERDWPAHLPWDAAAVMRYASTIRDVAKTIRYGKHYGKGPWGFGNTLFTASGDSLGEDRATQLCDAFDRAEPWLPMYTDFVAHFIREHGGIPSLSGRWCDLRDLVAGDDWQFKRALRRALNYPMQAGAADLVNAAMVAVAFHPRLRALGWRLCLQVHDELILRGPWESREEVLAIVVLTMESIGHTLKPNPFELPLQVSAHFGPSWAACK